MNLNKLQKKIVTRNLTDHKNFQYSKGVCNLSFQLRVDVKIELVDFKTTAQDPGMYMLWEPQITWYAMMLQAEFPDSLIAYRYLCMPTQGDKPGLGRAGG